MNVKGYFKDYSEDDIATFIMIFRKHFNKKDKHIKKLLVEADKELMRRFYKLL